MEAKMTVVPFLNPRFEYDPILERLYGVSEGNWHLLTKQIFPKAKAAESILSALEVCKLQNLDIYTGAVNIVEQYDSSAGGMIETVWPSFQSLLARAEGNFSRTETIYGPETKKVFSGKWTEFHDGKWLDRSETIELAFPEWAKVTITGFKEGRESVHPIKLDWLETYARIGTSEVPALWWRQKPKAQLEKCVIAAGLREAFPGTGYCAEEMAGRSLSVETPEKTVADFNSIPEAMKDRIAGAIRVLKQSGASDEECIARFNSRYSNLTQREYFVSLLRGTGT
jgi:hypothetical protein